MSRGTWLLIYTDFDKLENRDPVQENRKALSATTEQEAVREAKAQWSTIASKKYKGYGMWEETEYPHSPRLRYEVPLL
jgi:hypothetical protein